MFPKTHRVPREIIQKVLFEGEKIQTELFLLRKMENKLKHSRYAVVVSKKVEKLAVKRHYLKRIYKNILTNIYKDKKQDKYLDLVFVLSKKNKEVEKTLIREELEKTIS
jgi:ribonuclease P protein component